MDYQGLPKVYQYTDSKNISLISARPAYRYSLLSKTFNYPPLVFFLILYFPALVFCLMVLPSFDILPHATSLLWNSASWNFSALVFCLMLLPCSGILPHEISLLWYSASWYFSLHWYSSSWYFPALVFFLARFPCYSGILPHDISVPWYFASWCIPFAKKFLPYYSRPENF